MKTIIITFFFLFSLFSVTAQEAVSVRFASGGKDRLSSEVLKNKLQDLEAQGVKKLDLWKHLEAQNTDTSVSGVAIGLSGPIGACAVKAQQHGTNDPFKTVSWWAVDAPKGTPTTIVFRIKENGLATMDLVQNGQVIGSGRARTDDNQAGQPKAGTYKASKQPEKTATKACGRPARKSYQTTKKVGFDVYMTYPINIYAGFFAHGGNNSGKSGGCMRMNELCEVAYSFNITRIVIEHLP